MFSRYACWLAFCLAVVGWQSWGRAEQPPVPSQKDPPKVPDGPVPSLKLGKGDCILGRHHNGVSGVAFSPDGKIVATTGGDALIRLWDVTARKELRRCEGHQGFIITVAFAPDGKLLASGGHEKEIHLWDSATGKEVRRFAGHSGGIHQIVFSPDGKTLVSGGFDENVGVWDVATGKELRRIRAHGRVVYAVAISSDGKLLATGGDEEGIIRLWDLASGKELRHWLGHEQCVYSLSFTPDAKLLASGGGSRDVCIWEAATGKKVREFGGHEGGAYNVAFGPDGRTLATCSYTAKVHLWEVTSGKEIHQFGDHQGWVWGLAYAPTGRALLSGSIDTTAVLWDLGALTQGEQTRSGPLTAAEVEAGWRDLASADAARAFAAIWTLSAAPTESVAFLRDHLRRAIAVKVDAGRVARLIADLDDDRFDVRERATQELEKLGEAVAAPLRRALAGKPSLEMQRRLQELVDRLDHTEVAPEQLQTLRALQVLERINTPEARRVVEQLARGAAETALTQEAQAILQRLDKGSGVSKP
jgi:hypothetical protein